MTFALTTTAPEGSDTLPRMLPVVCGAAWRPMPKMQIRTRGLRSSLARAGTAPAFVEIISWTSEFTDAARLEEILASRNGRIVRCGLKEGESAKSMILADFIKRDDGTMIPK